MTLNAFSGLLAVAQASELPKRTTNSPILACNSASSYFIQNTVSMIFFKPDSEKDEAEDLGDFAVREAEK